MLGIRDFQFEIMLAAIESGISFYYFLFCFNFIFFLFILFAILLAAIESGIL